MARQGCHRARVATNADRIDHPDQQLPVDGAQRVAKRFVRFGTRNRFECNLRPRGELFVGE